jgi:ribosomal protein S19E (S16A)
MGLSRTQHQTLMHVAQSEKYSGSGATSNRGAMWMANQSQRGVKEVQQTLASLEQLGLVDLGDSGPSLTEKGRKVLADGPETVSFERNPATVERELLNELELERQTGGIMSWFRGLFG